MKSQYIIHLLFLIILVEISKEEKVYKLNDHVYFDPVSSLSCSHENYWTPWNQNTTCFRWVNLNANDTSNETTLKVMLDHNIYNDTYTNIKHRIKELKQKWIRYTGNITIPKEKLIYKLMGFNSKPRIGKSTFPKYRIGEMIMNNYYINNGTKINYRGYWVRNSYNKEYSYSFSTNGNNVLVKKSAKRGIRPVIKVKKELLKVIPDAIDIDSFVENGTLYKYKYDKEIHGRKNYSRLQGFTVTKERLIFSISNSKNPNYCTLYSYKGDKFQTLDNKKSDNECGHTNGITYNSKIKKIIASILLPYNRVDIYNPSDLKLEKTFLKPESYPSFSGIGYNEDKDFYLGKSGSRQIFFTKTSGRFPIQYSFSMAFYETSHDIEYHDGYIFVPAADLGTSNKYQMYSLWGKGQNLVYVYNAKFNSDGKPTKDFGRLVARLLIKNKGKLEGISFREEKVYLGFSTRKIDDTYDYKFYAVNYKDLKDKFIGSSLR